MIGMVINSTIAAPRHCRCSPARYDPYMYGLTADPHE